MRRRSPPDGAQLASTAMALDRSSSIDDLNAFYEAGYSVGGDAAVEGTAWRELSARVKAQNILDLAAPVDDTWRVLDVGCGDGVVLEHLRRTQPGWQAAGVEVADAPVQLARTRLPDGDFRQFDGTNLDWPDRHFDLVYATHVIEHVPQPLPLLREMARVGARVVVEVPLEDNRSARRPSRRRIAEEVGHVQRLSKESLHELMAEAGLRVTDGHSDPLERRAITFHARGPKAQVKDHLKWASRAALHAVAPGLARRLFTVHYSCIGRPA